MAEHDSSKYGDIISKCVQISSGCPKVYQMNPTTTKIGNISRLTVGERNVNHTNRTILFVGETGSGKSTLINALVNYAMGVTWEDEVWFQIVKDEKKSQTDSQTSDVIVYEVFGFEGQVLPFSLTLIDTPGYGAIKGTKEDHIVTARLYDLFRSADGIKEITAVALVIQASINRLSDRLGYIFNSVMSLFGKDMEKNIISLITHSTGDTPKNAFETLETAGVKCGKNGKGEPIHFLFNNNQHDDRTERGRFLKMGHEISIEGMEGLKSFLESNKPQNIKQSLDVLSECRRLPACIQNLKERMEFIGLKQVEIQKAKCDVAKCAEGKQEMVAVPVPCKIEQSIDGGWWGLFFYDGALRCTKCEENCHYPGCAIAVMPGHCEVIKGGKCTSCTNKCDVSHHRKDTTIYVTETRYEEMTLEEAHRKYGQYNSEYEECETNAKKNSKLVEKLQKELEGLKEGSKRLLGEAYGAVVKLHEISLNNKSMNTHVHLEWLIERMNEAKQPGKARILQDIKKQMDKDAGFLAGLKYKVTSWISLK